MKYEDALKNKDTLPHSVEVDNREKMKVFGVEEVDNFDEKAIAMLTTQGKLTVTGQNLNIEKLDLDNGELIITGYVSGLEYSDSAASGKNGFFSRLFG